MIETIHPDILRYMQSFLPRGHMLSTQTPECVIHTAEWTRCIQSINAMSDRLYIRLRFNSNRAPDVVFDEFHRDAINQLAMRLSQSVTELVVQGSGKLHPTERAFLQTLLPRLVTLKIDVRIPSQRLNQAEFQVFPSGQDQRAGNIKSLSFGATIRQGVRYAESGELPRYNACMTVSPALSHMTSNSTVCTAATSYS